MKNEKKKIVSFLDLKAQMSKPTLKKWCHRCYRHMAPLTMCSKNYSITTSLDSLDLSFMYAHIYNMYSFATPYF